MATSQSHEHIPAPADKDKPKDQQVGFGDLKLREAEAEKTMAAAAKRLTTPEALVHTREQMIREQLEEVVKQVGHYGEDYNLVEGEDRQKFQERVKKSTLIKEVYQLMQQAYVEQDKINPLNYDKEQPYTIIKREYGFDLAPSQKLKPKFNTKSFNLEDYISELFPQYADDVQEQKKEPAKSEEPKDKNKSVPTPVSDEAKARVEAAKAEGTITPEMIQSLDGYWKDDGNTAIGRITDQYLKLESSDSPPEMSYEEYVENLTSAYSDFKALQAEAGNTTSMNEDTLRANLKTSAIASLGRMPTDEEINISVEIIRNEDKRAKEIQSVKTKNVDAGAAEETTEKPDTQERPTDEEIADMEEKLIQAGLGEVASKKETE